VGDRFDPIVEISINFLLGFSDRVAFTAQSLQRFLSGFQARTAKLEGALLRRL
jgi:hypothetical protein